MVGAGKDGLGEFDYCAGHGTFVAGVVRQVAPTADLLVRRAIGQDGIGVDVDVAIAMLEAFDAGADIINLSLGTETPHDQPPVATMVALEIIGERLAADSERDVVVVAAAGNNATSRPVFPAAFSGMPQLGVPVVAVAGLSVDLEPADFSSARVLDHLLDDSRGGAGPLRPRPGNPGDRSSRSRRVHRREPVGGLVGYLIRHPADQWGDCAPVSGTR